jgi:hypothetical protein
MNTEIQPAGVVRTDSRRALEALRNGVPNRDAVRVLGCAQPEVERRFVALSTALEEAVPQGRQAPGLLVEGGFGSGKSHLLEYLQHLALSANFVCSRVVVSKETPLYDPGKVYRAAIETATVPGLSGHAITELALRLRPETGAYAEFSRWANESDSGVSALFPATLLLHERLKNEPELIEEITGFWSGEPLPISRVRQGLRQVGASATFVIKAVPLRELAQQRARFVARLIRGAGYRGWIWLIDEVELIGRYSLLQRGRSYAELARWLGKLENEPYPGLAAVAAITDDFGLAVLRQKGDREYVGARLQSRGTDEFMTLAARAEAGMRAIERDAVPLLPPDDAMLEQTYQQLKEIHGQAYDWQPPEIGRAERSLRRPMRAHVRRWINEWDLHRLYPGARLSMVEEELRPRYLEDQALEEGTETGDVADDPAAAGTDRDDGGPIS